MYYLLIIGLLAFGSCQTVPPPAEPEASPTPEQRLIAAIDTFRVHAYHPDYREAYRPLRDSLKQLFVRILQEEIPLAQPLPDLADHILIHTSSNGQLRLLGWDEQSGGTMHDMALLAQFEDQNGQVRVQILDDPRAGIDEDALPDGLPLSLYTLPGERYLILAWGTGGSGHHHEIAWIVEKEGATLRVVPKTFADRDYLLVVAARPYPIEMAFDAATLKLRHPTFEADPDIGFLEPTGEVAVWQYQDGQFLKKEE